MTWLFLSGAAVGVAMVPLEAWAKRTGRTRRTWTPFWVAGAALMLVLAAAEIG